MRGRHRQNGSVPRKVSTRNAAFQQWQALLTNRTKRQRAGEFLVQGVRPITLAAEHGWEIRTLLHAGRSRSRWADELLRRHDHVELSDELMRELGEKDEQELIAVVGLPEDRLDRIPPREDLLVVVFDRPATPGNIGTLIRSADAFGAHGVIVTGHAADPYDPRAVRASTGSLFAIPVVRVPSHREVLAWAHRADRRDRRARHHRRGRRRPHRPDRRADRQRDDRVVGGVAGAPRTRSCGSRSPARPAPSTRPRPARSCCTKRRGSEGAPPAESGRSGSSAGTCCCARRRAARRPRVESGTEFALRVERKLLSRGGRGEAWQR